MKVLLVDDDYSMVDSIEKFLKVRGFETQYAYNGLQALEIINKDKPDCVLLDIGLPGINGVETLKRIKEIDKNIKVIMVTGFTDEEEICKEFGCDGFMIKPVHFLELEKLIKGESNTEGGK